MEFAILGLTEYKSHGEILFTAQHDSERGEVITIPIQRAFFKLSLEFIRNLPMLRLVKLIGITDVLELIDALDMKLMRYLVINTHGRDSELQYNHKAV
mgnify:FL=1